MTAVPPHLLIILAHRLDCLRYDLEGLHRRLGHEPEVQGYERMASANLSALYKILWELEGGRSVA